jgi:hypothetical protein
MKEQEDKPVAYFFGYGSLMYPWGINGRGLKHKYQWSDLRTAWLRDYKRGMFARFMTYEYGPLLFYGLVKDPGSKLIGILLPLFSKRDLEILLWNEHAHPKQENKLYVCEKVNRKLNDVLIEDVPVYTLVCPNVATDGTIPTKYVVEVWVGSSFWGQQFINFFQETGGVQPWWVQQNIPKPWFVTDMENYYGKNYPRNSGERANSAAG